MLGFSSALKIRNENLRQYEERRTADTDCVIVNNEYFVSVETYTWHLTKYIGLACVLYWLQLGHKKLVPFLRLSQGRKDSLLKHI